MHLKVFVKLKINPKNPLVWAKKNQKPKKSQKTQKNPKKPKINQKNPLGWVLKKKTWVFSNPAGWQPQKVSMLPDARGQLIASKSEHVT
jgi:hypothetical protein